MANRPTCGESKPTLQGRADSPSNVPFQSTFFPPLPAAAEGVAVMVVSAQATAGAAAISAASRILFMRPADSKWRATAFSRRDGALADRFVGWTSARTSADALPSLRAHFPKKLPPK